MSARINKNRLAAGIILLLPLMLLLTGAANKVITGPEAEATETCDRTEAVTAHMREQGFSDGEFVLEDEFDLALPAASDAGDGSFSSENLHDRATLVRTLNSNDAGPTAAREFVLANTSSEDHELVRTGDGYVGVQFLVPTLWEGNTLFDGNGVQPASSTRSSAEGDILWAFVNGECVVQADASLRGPCNNPQTVTPKPDRPTDEPDEPTKKPTPPPTDSETPPPTDKPTTPPHDECPDKPGNQPKGYECKPETTENCQQNGEGEDCPFPPVQAEPQDNEAAEDNGVNTGDTPGAPSTPPSNTEPKPADNRETPSPAPPPTSDGSNSGSEDGSGTPSGSSTDDNGTTVGDNDTSDPEEDTDATGNQPDSDTSNPDVTDPDDEESEIDNPWG